MRFGLDAAYAPGTVGEAEQLRLRGWEWIAGYIGGKAQNVWTPGDWDRVQRSGFDLLPIWVAHLGDDPGRQVGVDEGNAAVATMQQLGFQDIVCLDIENGLRPEEYTAGFVDACHAGLVDVVVYGTPGSIGMHADIDHWWLAFWPGSPMRLQDAPPDFTYWQYAAGRAFDFNVCRDDALFATRSA